MNHFAEVFVNFQKRGKSKDPAGEKHDVINTVPSLLILVPPRLIEQADLDKKLAPWTSHDSPGKKRADSDKDSFSIKYVAVRYVLSLLIKSLSPDVWACSTPLEA